MKRILLLLSFIVAFGALHAQTTVSLNMRDGNVRQITVQSSGVIDLTDSSYLYIKESAVSNAVMILIDDIRSMTFVESLGIDECQVDACRFFPNPARDAFHVEAADQAEHSLALYTAVGQRVVAKTFVASETVSVAGLAKGLYMLKIDGKTSKLVIR